MVFQTQEEGNYPFSSRVDQAERLKRTLERTRPRNDFRDVRETVGRPENIRFTSDLEKREERRPRVQVSYTPSRSHSHSSSSSTKRAKWYVRYLVYSGWSFCAFLFLRLIFAGGGVLDYYQHTQKLERKLTELRSIQKDNASIVKEMNLLNKNRAFQKKLVRDHLGFIAQDEYLILFQKEKI